MQPEADVSMSCCAMFACELVETYLLGFRNSRSILLCHWPRMHAHDMREVVADVGPDVSGVFEDA